MDDISRRSGESIGDILDFLKERHAGDYDFHKLFDICIGSYNVNLILEMY